MEIIANIIHIGKIYNFITKDFISNKSSLRRLFLDTATSRVRKSGDPNSKIKTNSMSTQRSSQEP